ncbi:carbohydrate porin [Aliivibrio finisterrensis]|uniref:Carbohydrate porin n=1 Tax=Aliivibrio finisterrensis TaxID=511998 RepID=A0A6N6RV62_9GAMM|nr:carbohydrate porin [Aliivibrio finisterrensis]KAB2825220.1 carbohydrate porin [Aliivibrio finisterrensis]
MKLLPVALAVMATLSSFSIFAETDPLDNIQVDDQQPLVISPQTDIPDGIVFSGYARYGFHFSDDVEKYVSADGQLIGNAAGRLGNEGNGGEFQFAKGFVSDNGTIWDVVVMLEHWGDEVGLKKFYAGATNVFESQPNAYIWAGRDFHNRPQTGLNDYFWMMNDSQGAGIKNLEFGNVKFDMAAVAQVVDGGGTGDSGNYAITSKLHGINLTDALDLSLYANYGFSSKNTEKNREDDTTCKGVDRNGTCYVDDIDSYQLALELNHSVGMMSNKFVTRYGNNVDNNIFNKTEDLSTLLMQLEGKLVMSHQTNIEYLVGYQSLEDKNASQDDRANYSAIVRPTYAWNNIHSTWLEAGYSLVDFDNQSGQNDAWKVTLSQNISFDMDSGARPMLRFYATVGDSNTEVDLTRGETGKQDTFAVGAMWEAWW